MDITGIDMAALGAALGSIGGTIAADEGRAARALIPKSWGGDAEG